MPNSEPQSLRTHEQFHDLCELSPDATLVTNAVGVIAMVNQKAELLFGYERGELLGQPVEALLPESVRHGHVALRDAYMSAPKPRAMNAGPNNLVGRKKDGTVFPVDVSLSPLDSDEGTLVIAAVRDASQRVSAHNLALRTHRLESICTLAGGVAHDINNVLAPIIMVCGLLRKKYPDETELVDIIETSATRGADIVRQLLTYSRGVEGESILVQPQHLLKELEKAINGIFPKNIRLRSVCAPTLWTIMGDPTQLHDVLLNLCINAQDAMPNGGMLTVEMEDVVIDATYASIAPEAKPGRYVVWHVKDTGTGIQPEVLEHIFEPFFSTKSADKGKGLGLSSVMGIVRSHGGFIRVYTTLGQGTTFTVYLPAAVEAAPVASSESVDEFCGNGETVLVVDDEPAPLEAARTVLAAMNFRVLTASDGTRGLIKVAEHRTELRAVVTDLHMPGMGGLVMVRALRHMVPHVGIIVASGRVEDHEASELKALGVRVLLNKPFSQSKLVEALRAALEK